MQPAPTPPTGWPEPDGWPEPRGRHAVGRSVRFRAREEAPRW